MFAPLAFGSRHVWAYTLVQIGVFSLGFVYLLDKTISKRSLDFQWVRSPLNFFFVVFLLLGVLQTIPLPPEMVALISPGTAEDKAVLNEVLLKDAFDITAFSGWMSMTYNLHATRMEWLKMASYAAMFFLVINTAKTRKRLEMLVVVLLLVGCFEAVYAIYQIFSLKPYVWWWPARSSWASGTYIGSNQFAGYMELVVCLGFGYVIALMGKSSASHSDQEGAQTRWYMNFILSLIGLQRTRLALFFYITLVLGVALLLSASRGGILAISIAMLLVSLLFMAKPQYRLVAVATLSVCLVIFGYSYHIGIDRTLSKFESIDRQFENRMLETEVALPMVYDYAATGVGMGGLSSMYPRYAPSTGPQFIRRLTAGHLHNDWVTLGAELGIGGVMLVLTGVSFLIIRMLRVWYRRRDPFAVGLCIGAVAGIVSIGIHCYVELNMRIPANPLTLAAVAAIGYAAVHNYRKGRRDRFMYRVRRFQMMPLRRLGLSILIVSVYCFLVPVSVRHFLAEAYCATEWNSTLNLNYDPDLPGIEAAIRLNPLNAKYHYKKAQYFMRRSVADEAERRENNEKVIHSLENAARCNPAEANYWHDLGYRYSYRNYDQFNYFTIWLLRADLCFDQAVKWAHNRPGILFNAAWYWVWRSTQLSETDGSTERFDKFPPRTRQDAIVTFQTLFREAFEIGMERKRDILSKRLRNRLKKQKKPIISPLEKDMRKAIDRIWEIYPDPAIVIRILPVGHIELRDSVLAYLDEKERN